ncbi:hypothetical protein ACW5R3_10475 [Bizionia sp. KMM 8389]
MKRKKLFLDSTDVASMTGLSLRSARNMMQYIRNERGLGKHQVISIYDFCFVFSFPVHVVFVYINTALFSKDPIDADLIKTNNQKHILESGDMQFLRHKDMDLFMTTKELQERDALLASQEPDVA